MGKKEDGELGTDWRSTSDPRIKRRYNGQLYARFTKRGIRIEQRLHETTMAAASKAADLIEEKLRTGTDLDEIKRIFNKSLKEQPKQAVLLGELWPQFIEFRKNGDPRTKLRPWREKTLSHYVTFWERSFEKTFANCLPDEIAKAWPVLIESERKRSNKGEDLGFAHHLKYFNTFITWLLENKHIKEDPKIWDPNWTANEEIDEEDDVVFTDERVSAMINHAQDAFGVFIRCAALMGMRSSEITQLQKNRVLLDKKMIKLRASDVKTGSKTNTGRSIPIHPGAFDQLKAQIEKHPKSQFVFPNKLTFERPMDTTGFRKQWDKMMLALNLTTGTPHSLRHTYATKVFGNHQINPVLAAKALGMSMQTAEKVYIHFRDEQLSLVAHSFSYNNEQELKAPGTGLGLQGLGK